MMSFYLFLISVQLEHPLLESVIMQKINAKTYIVIWPTRTQTTRKPNRYTKRRMAEG